MNLEQNSNSNSKQKDKISEYVDRINSGETIEDFGDIPIAWKNEIQNRTTQKTNSNLLEGVVSEKIQEYVQRIKSGENKDFVIQGLPASFLSAIEIELAHKNVHEAYSEKKSQTEENNEKYFDKVSDEKLRETLRSIVDKTYTKAEARKVAFDNIENYTGYDLYTFAVEQLYYDLRRAEYDRTDDRINYDIEQITSEAGYLIKRVSDENGWHFRIPKTATSAEKSIGRFSLNVVANKDLVRKLDELTSKYGVYYKTPNQTESWNERNDPVTIYVNNPKLTNEDLDQLKQELVVITKPYIRSNQGFGYYGENLSEGVEFGPESTLEIIEEIKQKAAEIDDDLVRAIHDYFQKNNKLKSSVGQNVAAMRLISILKGNSK